MNSKTAIHRHFVRTPKIISLAAAGTFWAFITWLNPYRVEGFAVTFFIWIVSGVISISLMQCIGQWLTRRRLETWAEVCRGVHKDDLDSWIDEIDPEKLEEMVAWDFEGMYKEE